MLRTVPVEALGFLAIVADFRFVRRRMFERSSRSAETSRSIGFREMRFVNIRQRFCFYRRFAIHSHVKSGVCRRFSRRGDVLYLLQEGSAVTFLRDALPHEIVGRSRDCFAFVFVLEIIFATRGQVSALAMIRCLPGINGANPSHGSVIMKQRFAKRSALGATRNTATPNSGHSAGFLFAAEASYGLRR